MSKVYLLVVAMVDDHHPIHEPTIEVKTRAFVSPEVRVEATKRVIDRLIEGFDPEMVPEDYQDEALDSIEDMKFARTQGDLSYEMLCCRSAFGCEVEFQDIEIELEELVGEIVKA
jgi:hypothetical protein